MNKVHLDEFGGCLPLERIRDNATNPLRSYVKMECASGRVAILSACRTAQKNRIRLPLYLCPYVKTFLAENGIEVEEYNIDTDFCPQVDYSRDTMLLWTRYFGLTHQRALQSVLDKWPSEQVIVDNSQAFFAKPVNDTYNVYSLRKFIGVPDGAYLIGPGVDGSNSIYAHGLSWEYLEIATKSPNSAYSMFLDNDDGLMTRTGMAMVTREYVKGVDFEYIRNKRAANCRAINAVLCGHNELDINDDYDTMCYPFLREGNEALRKQLLDINIYTSTWWKRTLSDDRANTFEKYLTRNLIPIPMDQRYSEDEVTMVARIIAEKCGG